LRELHERGQSETLGVALLTGIVVILVGLVGAFLFADFGADDEEQLLANVEGDVEATGITLNHEGGDTFDADDIEVLLTGDADREFVLGSDFEAVEGGGDAFEPGDQWENDPLDDIVIGDGRLLVVDESTNTVLLDQPYSIEQDGVELAVETHPEGTLESDDATVHGNEMWDYEVTFILGGQTYENPDEEDIDYDLLFDGSESHGVLSHEQGEDAISAGEVSSEEEVSVTVDTDQLDETAQVDVTVIPEPDFVIDVDAGDEVGSETLSAQEGPGVVEGDDLGIEVTVTNKGGAPDSQEIDIGVENDGFGGNFEFGDSFEVDLDPEESTSETFTPETTPGEDDEPFDGDFGEYEITAESEDGSAGSDTVEILATPFFDVTIDSAPDFVAQGNDITLDTTVENLGNVTGEQTVELDTEPGFASESEEIEIDGGETESPTFDLETTGESGTVDIELSSDNSLAERSVSIGEIEIEDVSISEEDVWHGEEFEVNIDLDTSLGEDEVSAEVEVESGDATFETDSKTVTLDGEDDSVQFEATGASETGEANAGVGATVLINDDPVESEDEGFGVYGLDFDIDAGPQEEPWTAGEEIEFGYFVENNADYTDEIDVNVELSVAGGPPNVDTILDFDGAEQDELSAAWDDDYVAGDPLDWEVEISNIENTEFITDSAVASNTVDTELPEEELEFDVVASDPDTGEEYDSESETTVVQGIDLLDGTAAQFGQTVMATTGTVATLGGDTSVGTADASEEQAGSDFITQTAGDDVAGMTQTFTDPTPQDDPHVFEWDAENIIEIEGTAYGPGGGGSGADQIDDEDTADGGDGGYARTAVDVTEDEFDNEEIFVWVGEGGGGGEVTQSGDGSAGDGGVGAWPGGDGVNLEEHTSSGGGGGASAIGYGDDMDTLVFNIAGGGGGAGAYDVWTCGTDTDSSTGGGGAPGGKSGDYYTGSLDFIGGAVGEGSGADVSPLAAVGGDGGDAENRYDPIPIPGLCDPEGSASDPIDEDDVDGDLRPEDGDGFAATAEDYVVDSFTSSFIGNADGGSAGGWSGSDGDDGEVEIEVTGTIELSVTAPTSLEPGETFEADYEIENTADNVDTVPEEHVVLYIDGEWEEGEYITSIDAGETIDGTLTYEDTAQHEGGSFFWEVDFGGDEYPSLVVDGNTDVAEDTDPGDLEITSITPTQDPVEPDSTLDVEYVLQNNGDDVESDDIELYFDDGFEDSDSVSASGGDTDTGTLSGSTADYSDGDTIEVTVELDDDGDSETRTVDVEEDDDGGDDPDGPELIIDDIDAPGQIEPDEDLKINYEVENIGSETDSDFIDLFVDEEDGFVDFDSIEVDPGETVSGTLTFEEVEDNYDESEEINWEVKLFSFDDSQSGTTVVGEAEPNLIIDDIDAPGQIGLDEDLELTYTLENVGNADGTETFVDLLVEDTDSEFDDTDSNIKVPAGETVTGTLTFDEVSEYFEEGDTIDWEIELWDFGDTQSGTTTIEEGDDPADIQITDVGAPDSIAPTDSLTVGYTLTNIGDETGTESAVNLLVDGTDESPDDTDSDVTLEGGESTGDTLTFENVIEHFSDGDIIELTVELEDFGESEQESVYVEGEEDFQVSILDFPDEVSVGDTLDVDYQVENIGTAEGTVDVGLEIPGIGVVNSDEESLAPDETTTGTLLFDDLGDLNLLSEAGVIDIVEDEED